MSFKKNTAVTGFPFALVSASDGSAITTGTVTGYVTLDGGTQATIAGAAVHEGNGQWTINLTAGEMNGDVVGLLFTHASAINTHFTIKTETKLVSELQDIAATDIVSAGAITTLSGAVVNVDTVDTCTANTDMRGTDNALLAANVPTNFTDLAITATTGRVDINANNDKTGYSLSQAFPTNFADLAITVTTGQVTVGTNNDKTGYSISGTKTTLDALNDLTAAQVNAEVVDALTVDTYAEPGQGTPAATASLKDKIGYIFKALRNRKTSTATQISIYNDDATTVDHKRTISDNGTTYDEGELTTGP